MLALVNKQHNDMQNNIITATISNDNITVTQQTDVDARANIRARLVACMFDTTVNTTDKKYDVVCNANTFVVENCYLKILRHSSHKSFCQIYAKRDYVLVLISRHSVDVENDSFTHDSDSVERLSNQSCYSRYRMSYDACVSFFRALSEYDTRRNEQTATATEQQTEQQTATA